METARLCAGITQPSWSRPSGRTRNEYPPACRCLHRETLGGVPKPSCTRYDWVSRSLRHAMVESSEPVSPWKPSLVAGSSEHNIGLEMTSLSGVGNRLEGGHTVHGPQLRVQAPAPVSRSADAYFVVPAGLHTAAVHLLACSASQLCVQVTWKHPQCYDSGYAVSRAGACRAGNAASSADTAMAWC